MGAKIVARKQQPGRLVPATAVRRWADLLVCEHLALETL
jgi:hypothetical protein